MEPEKILILWKENITEKIFKKELYAEQDILQMIRLGIGVCLDTYGVNSDLLFYS